MRAGRKDPAGMISGAVHAIDAGDQRGFELRLAPVDKILVADVEVLCPAAGEVKPRRDSLRAAMTASAMTIENGLYHRWIIDMPAAPGLRLQATRRASQGLLRA